MQGEKLLAFFYLINRGQPCEIAALIPLLYLCNTIIKNKEL